MFLAQKWMSLSGGGRRGGTWTGVWAGMDVFTTVAPYDSVNDKWSNQSGVFGRLTVTKDKVNKKYHATYWVCADDGTNATFTGSADFGSDQITVNWYNVYSTTVTWNP